MGARYAMCMKCGQTWNISRFEKITPPGYICPSCRRRKKKANGTVVLKGIAPDR